MRITVRSPVAVSYLAQAPGALGLARAYVSGHLDVDGDMYTALCTADAGAQQRTAGHGRAAPAAAASSAARGCSSAGSPPPPQEVRVNRRWLGGRRHSKGRDASAISHHYDVSNTLLRVGARPVDGLHLRRATRAPDATLEEAQDVQVRPGRQQARPAAGHAAARRRLRLGRHGHARRPRVRRQGARRDPVRAAGGLGAAGDRATPGLADLAEVRHLDYRDVPETGFDAVSSIGLTEHIGKAQLPGYFSLPARQAAARAGGCSTTASPGRTTTSPRGVHGRVHQPLRVPRRRARGSRVPGLAR